MRRKERDDQEAKRKARDLALAGTPREADAANGGTNAGAKAAPNAKAAADDDSDSEVASPTAQDDGLQPDERSLQTDLKREKQAKQRRDVVLDEAAHILADEINLVRSDSKLAAQVLPHAAAQPVRGGLTPRRASRADAPLRKGRGGFASGVG